MTLKSQLTDLQIEFAMVDFVARRGRPGRIEVLRIEGNLSTKYDKVVSEWVLLHRDKLIETWKQLQAGDDVTKLIEALAGKPEYKKVIRPQNPAEL